MAPPPSRHDVIIIGGGTAGCVLAARLSEVESLSVLLLEAGGNHNDDPRVKTPMLLAQAIGDPKLDWDHHAVPQEQIHGKTTLHPRGKGLGGSSLINYMGLQVAAKSTYDAWAAAGNSGWSWNDLLPYLRKSQSYNSPSEKVAGALALEHIQSINYGRDGPVQWSHAHEVHPLEKMWIDTFRELGQLIDQDPMSGLARGGFSALSAVDTSRERCHSAIAYLEIAKKRPNLTVISDATVERILTTNKRATGVVYTLDGVRHSVGAKREVIVCCGTFESPALLERSGIGKASTLHDLGIDSVVINENVGENLQDHMFHACSFEIKAEFATLDDFRDPEYIGLSLKEYNDHRTGPLAATFTGMAHLPLPLQTPQLDVDSLLSSYNGPKNAAFETAEAYVRQLLLKNEEASAAYCFGLGQVNMERTESQQSMIAPTSPGKYISIYMALAHPLSRGNVHARSLKVGDIAIDPRYYTHPLDVALAARHVKYFDTIANTEPLKSAIIPNGRRIPEWASFDSLEETEKLVRSSNSSYYHPVGTCSMLPEKNGGVVDARLRVYGIQGLRVCDASIMPIVPRGTIMSSVYTLAEKGADLIKEDLGFSSHS